MNFDMKKASIILMVLFFGCKAAQVNTEGARVVYMKKTPCMGTCPNYDISIFSNGNVVLNAREHVGMEGTFNAKLTDNQFASLMEAFESNDFFSYRDSYKSNKTDLPTTTISFKQDGKEKTIVDYDGAPQSLKDLEQKVDDLLELLNWKPAK